MSQAVTKMIVSSQRLTTRSAFTRRLHPGAALSPLLSNVASTAQSSSSLEVAPGAFRRRRYSSGETIAQRQHTSTALPHSFSNHRTEERQQQQRQSRLGFSTAATTRPFASTACSNSVLVLPLSPHSLWTLASSTTQRYNSSVTTGKAKTLTSAAAPQEKTNETKIQSTTQRAVVSASTTFPTPNLEEKQEAPVTEPEHAATWGERYADRRDYYKEQAGLQYREFREHPGQQARKGAANVRDMIQKYGPVFVGTFLSIYVATLATLFTGVQSGLLDPAALFSMLGHGGEQNGAEIGSTVDLVVQFLSRHSWTQGWAVYVQNNPSVANLAVAWIAVKFTEPPRLAAAIAITPRIARYFKVGPAAADQHDDDAHDDTHSTITDATKAPNNEQSHYKSEGKVVNGIHADEKKTLDMDTTTTFTNEDPTLKAKTAKHSL